MNLRNLFLILLFFKWDHYPISVSFIYCLIFVSKCLDSNPKSSIWHFQLEPFMSESCWASIRTRCTAMLQSIQQEAHQEEQCLRRLGSIDYPLLLTHLEGRIEGCSSRRRFASDCLEDIFTWQFKHLCTCLENMCKEFDWVSFQNLSHQDNQQSTLPLNRYRDTFRYIKFALIYFLDLQLLHFLVNAD